MTGTRPPRACAPPLLSSVLIVELETVESLFLALVPPAAAIILILLFARRIVRQRRPDFHN
jgi:hypothetical protein